MKKFRLVKPSRKHREQALSYVSEFCQHGAKAVNGANGLDKTKTYGEWLEKIKADRARKVSHEDAPTETFFLVQRLPKHKRIMYGGLKEKIIGMISIRTELNHTLWNHGGNIGYSIRLSERNKGYGKLNLFLALCLCQKRGIKVVLLTCSKENSASAKVIKSLNGKLIRECENPDATKDGIKYLQYYIIDVKNAIKKHRAKYKPMISELPK